MKKTVITDRDKPMMAEFSRKKEMVRFDPFAMKP